MAWNRRSDGADQNERSTGPLAPLYRFKTEEEVVERANEPDVGLAG